MSATSPDLPHPQVEAEGVDTRQFRLLLADVIDASERGHETYAKSRQRFIAHIDSIITARVADLSAQLDLMTEYRESGLRTIVELRRELAALHLTPAELTMGTPEGSRVYAKGYATGRKKGFQDAQAAPACAIPGHWRGRAEWIANGTNLDKAERGNLAVMLLRTLLKAPQAASAKAEGIPDVLFDGYSVLEEITRKLGKSHCHSPDTVSATLSAVVRLMRRESSSTPAKEPT